jgi:hypothetical protein
LLGFGLWFDTTLRSNAVVRHQDQSVSSNGLTVQFVGSCDSGGVTMKGSGFTGTTYKVQVFKPDGSLYDYIKNNGVHNITQGGTTENFKWNCYDVPGGQPDHAGKYKVVVTNEADQRQVVANMYLWYNKH